MIIARWPILRVLMMSLSAGVYAMDSAHQVENNYLKTLIVEGRLKTMQESKPKNQFILTNKYTGDRFIFDVELVEFSYGEPVYELDGIKTKNVKFTGNDAKCFAHYIPTQLNALNRQLQSEGKGYVRL